MITEPQTDVYFTHTIPFVDPMGFLSSESNSFVLDEDELYDDPLDFLSDEKNNRSSSSLLTGFSLPAASYISSAGSVDTNAFRSNLKAYANEIGTVMSTASAEDKEYMESVLDKIRRLLTCGKHRLVSNVDHGKTSTSILRCKSWKPSPNLGLPACPFCTVSRAKEMRENHYRAAQKAEDQDMQLRRLVMPDDTMARNIITSLDLKSPHYMRTPLPDGKVELIIATDDPNITIGERYTKKDALGMDWIEWLPVVINADPKRSMSGGLGRPPAAPKKNDDDDSETIKVRNYSIVPEDLSVPDMEKAGCAAEEATSYLDPHDASSLQYALDKRRDAIIEELEKLGVKEDDIIIVSMTVTTKVSRINWNIGITENKDTKGVTESQKQRDYPPRDDKRSP